jgi:hypothetical protein
VTVEYAAAPHVVARTAAATALVMAGATLAHTWAGGALPGLPALLALAGVVYGATVLVLRWRVPAVLLTPFVLVAQGGLHGMFGLLGPGDPHAAHAGMATTSAVEPFTWRMVLAHLLSTLLAVLVWWLSQRAATAVVHAIRLWDTYAGGRRDATLRAPAAGKRPAALVCLVGAPRRGPPVRVA